MTDNKGKWFRGNPEAYAKARESLMAPVGERDPRVTLTWKPTPRQMVDIEQQFRLGRSDECIAEIYSVDPADIANIQRGEDAATGRKE